MSHGRVWSRRVALIGVLGALGVGLVSACAAPSGQTVTVVIDGAAYAPAKVTAHVGDTVVWRNSDVVDHTATDRHNAFRVEIAAGKSASLVVKQAGTFEYYCEYHPNMTATLTVEPAPAR